MKTLDAKTLEILRQLKDGEIQLEQVIDFLLLSGDAHDDIEMPDAVLDMGREERTGFCCR
jgi:dTDP-glucose pyrophosphorylase